MQIVAVTTDLMLVAPLGHTARQADVAFRALPPAELTNSPFDSPPQLFLVDITATDDIASVIQAARNLVAKGGEVIAFGPHVQTDKLQAAANAGATRVVARGQIEQLANAFIKSLSTGS